MSFIAFAVPAMAVSGFATAASVALTVRTLMRDRRARTGSVSHIEVRRQDANGEWHTVIFRATASDAETQSNLLATLGELKSTERIKSA